MPCIDSFAEQNETGCKSKIIYTFIADLYHEQW